MSDVGRMFYFATGKAGGAELRDFEIHELRFKDYLLALLTASFVVVCYRILSHIVALLVSLVRKYIPPQSLSYTHNPDEHFYEQSLSDTLCELIEDALYISNPIMGIVGALQDAAIWIVLSFLMSVIFFIKDAYVIGTSKVRRQSSIRFNFWLITLLLACLNLTIAILTFNYGLPIVRYGIKCRLLLYTFESNLNLQPGRVSTARISTRSAFRPKRLPRRQSTSQVNLLSHLASHNSSTHQTLGRL